MAEPCFNRTNKYITIDTLIHSNWCQMVKYEYATILQHNSQSQHITIKIHTLTSLKQLKTMHNEIPATTNGKKHRKNVTAFYDANTGNIYKQEISDNVNAAAWEIILTWHFWMVTGSPSTVPGCRHNILPLMSLSMYSVWLDVSRFALQTAI